MKLWSQGGTLFTWDLFKCDDSAVTTDSSEIFFFWRFQNIFFQESLEASASNSLWSEQWTMRLPVKNDIHFLTQPHHLWKSQNLLILMLLWYHDSSFRFFAISLIIFLLRLISQHIAWRGLIIETLWQLCNGEKPWFSAKNSF